MTLISPNEEPVGSVLDRHFSVKAAVERFGYNAQYLRRLLRAGPLEGIKIGQIWLIIPLFLHCAQIKKHPCFQ